MKTNIKIDVYCSSSLVGTLALTSSKKVAFQYSDYWLENGFSINPFCLPLKKDVFVASKPYFGGLFGVFADSLPDSWGRLLLDRYLVSIGKRISDFNVLDRLCFIGDSGIGALEYKPSYDVEIDEKNIDLDSIASECKKILETKMSDKLDTLFKKGGSSGGSRPKIFTKINEDYWIIKFQNHMDRSDIGKMEYEYMKTAKKCGIKIPEINLFESSLCEGYFGVKRFDRNGNAKIHTVTVAGLLEVDFESPSLDYDSLFKLTKILTRSQKDIEQIYLRMCFNVFAHNQDDHAKNFSYIYKTETKKWELAPAYDLTYSSTYYGEHTTSINGKGKNILDEDLVFLGNKYGIKKEKCFEMLKSVKKIVDKELGKYLY